MSFAVAEDLKLAITDLAAKHFPEQIAIAEKAFGLAGHKTTKVILPLERAASMLAEGTVDADVFRLESYNQKTPSAVKVETPVAYLNMMAAVSYGSPINSLDMLIGKSMALTRGVQAHRDVAANYHNSTTSLETFEKSARFVASGRADFVPLTERMAAEFISNGIAIRVLEEPILEVPMFIWLSSEQGHLKDGIEKSLQMLFAESAED